MAEGTGGGRPESVGAAGRTREQAHPPAQERDGRGRDHLRGPEGREGIREEGIGQDLGRHQGDRPGPRRRREGDWRRCGIHQKGRGQPPHEVNRDQRRPRHGRVRLRSVPRFLPRAVPPGIDAFPRDRRRFLHGRRSRARHPAGSGHDQHGQDSDPPHGVGRLVRSSQPDQGIGGRAHARRGRGTDQLGGEEVLQRIGHPGVRD
mmetsp:Transcript_915/g.2630  ORF Transcript_915/g.2630 Transcript_915/m.2630 type:complete len:204 (+) Transcript_915:608-1219(+)